MLGVSPFNRPRMSHLFNYKYFKTRPVARMKFIFDNMDKIISRKKARHVARLKSDSDYRRSYLSYLNVLPKSAICEEDVF